MCSHETGVGIVFAGFIKVVENCFRFDPGCFAGAEIFGQGEGEGDV